MKTSCNIYWKHLDLSKRIQIESSLNDNKNFVQIAKLVNKSRKTISDEIKRHRILEKCNRYGMTKGYDVSCPKTKKAPYVCNGCTSRKGCRKDRYIYYAADAQNAYKDNLSKSRQGIDLTSEEFHKMNNIISDEIKKGHSFNMIIANHKDEFTVGKRTLYNYIEKGYLDIINLDLPMKVRYKKRKKSEVRKNKDTKHRLGRTYLDFQKEITLKHYFNIVLMDTVEGVKGESVLLTLLFTYDNFMLAFKLEDKTTKSVIKAFDNLKDILGYDGFYELFPIILTDNGSEFSAPDIIEYNGPNIPKSKVYYCDPRQSGQKGSLENNHRFIRRYIPKGFSFDNYSQEDINLMINQINSIPREILLNNTPFEIRFQLTKEKVLKKLNLRKVNKTEVIIHDGIFKETGIKKDTK